VRKYRYIVGNWINVRFISFNTLLNCSNVLLVFPSSVCSNSSDVGTPKRTLRSCRTAAFEKGVN